MPSITAGGMHTHHEVSLRYVHAAATIMSVSSVVSNRRRAWITLDRELGCAARSRPGGSRCSSGPESESSCPAAVTSASPAAMSSCLSFSPPSRCGRRSHRGMSTNAQIATMAR